MAGQIQSWSPTTYCCCVVVSPAWAFLMQLCLRQMSQSLCKATVQPVHRMRVLQVAMQEEKKGSDSAINNGGKRPGLVAATPTDADIEMTAGELAAEDEQAAIEER